MSHISHTSSPKKLSTYRFFQEIGIDSIHRNPEKHPSIKFPERGSSDDERNSMLDSDAESTHDRDEEMERFDDEHALLHAPPAVSNLLTYTLIA